jgi:4-amino-4-deoxy-L-arabinose transferase-like glycosyltransferase
VPLLLAVGHEFVLGSYLGPPLAFWLGEIAFKVAGSFGLYALAQACIVIAYWAVFALGRAIVGTRHAVLAVLLMVGIAAFTVPSPNFGPAILAAPLWALALLYYWRAVGEGRRGYWFLLALDLGLLLLASYAGLILLALMIAFTLATARGRSAMLNPEPWIALLLLWIVIFPHAAWLSSERSLVIEGINESLAATGRLSAGVWLCVVLVLSHLGLALLVTLASGWPRHPRERAPEIERNPVGSFPRIFVYVFALAPALIAIAVAFATGRLGPLDRIAPLVVLSGLAVVVAAGDKVLL